MLSIQSLYHPKNWRRQIVPPLQRTKPFEVMKCRYGNFLHALKPVDDVEKEFISQAKASFKAGLFDRYFYPGSELVVNTTRKRKESKASEVSKVRKVRKEKTIKKEKNVKKGKDAEKEQKNKKNKKKSL